MSTVVFVVLIVAVAAVAIAATVRMGRTGFGRPGGGSLQRRFGPEYDRVLARHNGDTKAAQQELGRRVQLYGSIVPHTLPPEVREQYVSRWTAAQEHFVDSPGQALAEADQLLGALARARGFPGPERHDEHIEALSVHHGYHIDGYRRVQAAAAGRTSTEEMREAMLQARAYFDALVAEHPGGSERPGRRGRTGRTGRTGRPLTHDGPVGKPLMSEDRGVTGREAS